MRSMSAFDIDAAGLACGFATDALAAIFAGDAATLAAALAGLEGSRPMTVIDLRITGLVLKSDCEEA